MIRIELEVHDEDDFLEIVNILLGIKEQIGYDD
jgi:hypothetical protein